MGKFTREGLIDMAPVADKNPEVAVVTSCPFPPSKAKVLQMAEDCCSKELNPGSCLGVRSTQLTAYGLMTLLCKDLSNTQISYR